MAEDDPPEGVPPEPSEGGDAEAERVATTESRDSQPATEDRESEGASSEGASSEAVPLEQQPEAADLESEPPPEPGAAPAPAAAVEPEPVPATETAPEPEPEVEPAPEPEPELSAEEQAEAAEAERLASEREANRKARLRAAEAEQREKERAEAAEREEQERLEQLEREKKERQARRAAKMQKRAEAAQRQKEERVIAQYSLTKTAKGLGKKVKRRMSVVPGSTPLGATQHAPDLRVFRMTQKKMETLELVKGEMKPTGTYQFADSTFTARPVEGTKDQVVLTVTTAKGKAAEKVYRCEDRAALLSDVALACYKAKDEEPRRYPGRKYTRNNRMREVLFGVGGGRLMQMDPGTGRVLSEYLLRDIRAVSFVNDDALPNGFVIKRKHRTHIFLCEHREQLVERMLLDAMSLVGVFIPEPPIEERTLEEILEQRHGVMYAKDGAGVVKFDVYKRTQRHSAPVPRRLCVSGSKLAELDADTGGLVSVHHMGTVFAIVSDPGEQQWLTIEFMDGSKRHYMSSTREALIACLLDACDTSGNSMVLHRLEETEPGWIYGPKWQLLETSWESHFFHSNIQASGKDEAKMMRVLTEFSVQNLGDSQQAAPSIVALFASKILMRANDPDAVNVVIAVLQTLQLLLQQTYGFLEFSAAMAQHDGAAQLAACLRSDDEDMRFQTALVMIHAARHRREKNAVFRRACAEDEIHELEVKDIRAPAHPDGSDGSKVEVEAILEATRKNKFVIGESEEVRVAITRALCAALRSASGHLVVKGLVDVLQLFLLEPGVEDTAPEHYNELLYSVGSLEGNLFSLFFHPSTPVMQVGAELLAAITRDSTPDQAAEMQRTAMREGAFLKHLYAAIFSDATQGSALSRKLVAMFADSNEEAIDVLRQMLPRGILYFLIRKSSQAEKEQGEAEHKGPRTREEILAQKARKKEMLKRHLESAASVEDAAGENTEYSNWDEFWVRLHEDFNRGDLIWNATTRAELKSFMEAEIAAVGLDKQAAVLDTAISWNHSNFEVVYPSLLAEPMIGNLYLNKLLERREKGENVEKRLLKEVERDGNPERFVNWAFERFLLSHDDDTKALCLKIMTIVYKKHHMRLPVFRAMRDVVEMIDHTFSRRVRDSLLMLIVALLYEPLNAKAFMNAGGIEVITELMSLVHWDDSLKIAAAQLQDAEQVMMLEDSAEGTKAPATYWFYKVPKGFDDAGQERGPLSLTALEQLWSAGHINGDTLVHTKDDWEWKSLASFRCLRWKFMMTGSSPETPVDVAAGCLDIMLMLVGMFPVKDIFGTNMKPLPRARVMLSDMKKVLPHVVQVLLTQHPKLIESASVLVKMIVEENADLVRKLYRSGLFCFAFMYQGSNVLPLVELVKATHDKQQFQGFEDALRMSDKNIVKKSILSTIFPDSLVLYLHHRSQHDFVKTYLGENDTPELIWTKSMRDVLMHELAQHTADFAWQLREFPMSVYEYEPVPAIAFEELKEEVWLHTVYLKNLSDTVRFPHWVIDEPVELLQALLTYWSSLGKEDKDHISNTEANELLGANKETTPAELKKLYRKLAVKYHPDKNPDGHEMFQKITKAYEHLTKNKGVGEERKAAHGVKMVLSAHVVLYTQHLETLAPYKYAGYDMLLAVLNEALGSDEIFSGEDTVETLHSGLLTILLTVRSSPKNGEEFCRRSGITMVEQTLMRCAEVLTVNTAKDDMAFAHAVASVRIFALLLQDSEFLNNGEMYHRKGMIPHELGQNKLLRELVRFLQFQQNTKLLQHTIACIDGLCSNELFQAETVVHGAVFLLLPLVFWLDAEQSQSDPDYAYAPHDPTKVLNGELTELQRRDACAREACVALRRLAGWDRASSGSGQARDLLYALLGPMLAKLLEFSGDDTFQPPESLLGPEKKTLPFLECVNSHQEIPEMKWSTEHEKQLVDFCAQQVSDLQAGHWDNENVRKFEFTADATELRVHGIFVRLLNKRTAEDGYHTDVEDADRYLKTLLEWLTDSEGTCGRSSLQNPTRGEHTDQNLALALQSLMDMLKTSPVRTEAVSECGASICLFDLLKVGVRPAHVQALALDVLKLCGGTTTAKKKSIVSDLLDNPDSLTGLCCILKAGTLDNQKRALYVVEVFVRTPKLLSELLKRGIVMYLLAHCSSSEHGLSKQAWDLLKTMGNSPLHGLAVTEAMGRFLPAAVVAGVTSDATSGDSDEFSFTADSRTPEMIWNDKMALQFRQCVGEQLDLLHTKQLEDSSTLHSLDPDFCVQCVQLFQLALGPHS